MRKRNAAFYTAWAAVFAWMWLIYSFSAQTAEVSASVSGQLIRGAVVFVRPELKNDPLMLESVVSSLQTLVRKCAHFCLYAVLGLFAAGACTATSPLSRRRHGAAWGLCALYAASDELHQLYVPGRSGELRDVCIDSAGALLGVAVFALFYRLARRFFAPKRTP